MIAQGIPAGRVLSVPEILGHPHLAERKFISTFETTKGRQKMTRGGFLFLDDEPIPDRPAPELSQHTDYWLQKLNYDATVIADFRNRGII